MDIMETKQESSFQQIYISQNNDNNENQLTVHISETAIKRELKTEFDKTIKKEYEVDMENIEHQDSFVEPVTYVRDKEGTINKDSKGNNEILANLTLMKKEVDVFETELNDISENHCFHDKDAYTGYCTKCSILSRILHNCLVTNIDNCAIQTIPKNVLEIQTNSSIDSKVFALRTIPKNVIFGPFAGGSITAENRNDSTWKIKNGKLLNDIDTNWMGFVNCTNDVILSNLEMFQYENDLYFRTCREIDNNGELLIHFEDERFISKEDEIYYCPVVENEFLDVYACSFCCLGYRTNEYLIEHKKRCPELNVNDFEEIIRCDSCKIYLEQHEYFEYHLSYCLEKQERLSKFSAEIYPNNINLSNNTNHVEDTSAPQTNINNANEITKAFKCTQCPYDSKYRSNLYQHLNTHKAVKPFRCDICMLTFARKDKMILHVKNKHTQGIPKDYKCPKCSYETNRKSDFETHQNIHTGIKLYQCDICMMGFNKTSNLKRHVKDIHTEHGTKDYKCSHCTYETNYKAHLKRHLETHTDVKSFQCAICAMGF